MTIDLLFQSLIIITLLANFLIGLIVLKNNTKNKINIAFSVICFMLSFWGIFLFLYGTPLFLTSYFWIKATYTLISIEVPFILGFSFIFPRPIYNGLRLPALIYSAFYVGISCWWLFFTNDWIVDVVNTPDRGLQTILGDTYKVWSVLVWVTFGWALFNFVMNIRKAVSKEQIQLQYLFLGLGFWGIFVSVLDIILPIFFTETRYFSLSVVTSLFFTVSVSYAIIKHQFMDIRLIVARSIAYALLLLILGTFYTTGMFLASTYFIKQTTNATSLAVSTILALFVAFTFQPLKTELEKLTDKIFFKGHYDMQDLLSSLGTIMNSYIDLELLNKRILETITEEVRITRGAFIVFGEDTSSIYNIIEIGFNNRFVMSYPEASSFFPLLETTVFDDLEEGQVKNLMRERNISLVRILKVKDKIIGLLVLGGKASGEIYSSQDLKFLDIISPEVAVAIQNSLSYDKIKKFNYILSQEIQKATADLKQANTRLKELDSLKNDFVSIASHELRTPMTAIRSYAWMALHRSDVKLSEKMEKYLIRVLLSTERLINLVNDMLNISRIEAGKIEIIPEPIDPVSLCKDIIDEVYYSKSLSKKVNFHLLENKVPKVFADPDKLRQVLLNLVGNSLKFTQDGGSITLSCFSDGKVVEIAVKDTGTGISKDDLGRLFQKFSRLDNSYVAAATSGGTGLGLYISKRIIELMHGRIWASSEGVGKGATFTFSLPVASKEVLEHADLYTIKPIDEVKPLEPAAI